MEAKPSDAGAGGSPPDANAQRKFTPAPAYFAVGDDGVLRMDTKGKIARVKGLTPALAVRSYGSDVFVLVPTGGYELHGVEKKLTFAVSDIVKEDLTPARVDSSITRITMSKGTFEITTPRHYWLGKNTTKGAAWVGTNNEVRTTRSKDGTRWVLHGDKVIVDEKTTVYQSAGEEMLDLQPAADQGVFVLGSRSLLRFHAREAERLLDLQDEHADSIRVNANNTVAIRTNRGIVLVHADKRTERREGAYGSLDFALDDRERVWTFADDVLKIVSASGPPIMRTRESLGNVASIRGIAVLGTGPDLH
jgi:hypothetical protein